MPQYLYTPLPEVRDVGRTPPFTRVMTLLPGETSDPILCTLEVINIEIFSQGSFEALSYVWGSQQPPAPVYCGGDQLNVTPNLDQALRCLRSSDNPRRLWVDAICINQGDITERARKVSYMRLVYKYASSVVVWLGLKVCGVESAFNFAKYLAGLRADLLCNTTGTSDPLTVDAVMHPEVHLWMAESINAEPQLADDLTRFLEREYFERVWCIQEVIASRRAVAKCEELEMDFFDLIAVGRYMGRIRGVEGSSYILKYWDAICQVRQRKLKSSNRGTVEGSVGPLLDLLGGVREFKSTNPRDRLFSVVGISDEGLELEEAPTYMARHPALVPDYRKYVRDVYRDFTRFHISKGVRRLDVLSHVQHNEDMNHDWPSWVPKFFQPNAESTISPEFYLSGICDQGHYSHFASLHDCPPYGEPQDPDCLRLDGFIVDEVEAISEVASSWDIQGELRIGDLWNSLFDMPLFPRPNQQYLVGTKKLDTAFFLTLNIGVMAWVQSKLPELAELGLENDMEKDFELMTLISKQCIFQWLQTYRAVLIASYTDLSEAAAKFPDLQRFFGDANLYVRSAYSFCRNRRVYKTSTGLLGVGPKVMKGGDQVVVLFGGALPFALRSNGNDWIFLGHTYLHHEGILMGREAAAVRSGQGNSRIEAFRLR